MFAGNLRRNHVGKKEDRWRSGSLIDDVNLGPINSLTSLKHCVIILLHLVIDWKESPLYKRFVPRCVRTTKWDVTLDRLEDISLMHCILEVSNNSSFVAGIFHYRFINNSNISILDIPLLFVYLSTTNTNEQIDGQVLRKSY